MYDDDLLVYYKNHYRQRPFNIRTSSTNEDLKLSRKFNIVFLHTTLLIAFLLLIRTSTTTKSLRCVYVYECNDIYMAIRFVFYEIAENQSSTGGNLRIITGRLRALIDIIGRHVSAIANSSSMPTLLTTAQLLLDRWWLGMLDAAGLARSHHRYVDPMKVIAITLIKNKVRKKTRKNIKLYIVSDQNGNTIPRIFRKGNRVCVCVLCGEEISLNLTDDHAILPLLIYSHLFD